MVKVHEVPRTAALVVEKLMLKTSGTPIILAFNVSMKGLV